MKQIIENLDNISSACLSVTARRFYRIHSEVHGKVSYPKDHEQERILYGTYYDGRSEITIRLNTWMETGGYIWIGEAARRSFKFRGEGYRQYYTHYFPGVFVKVSWLESLGEKKARWVENEFSDLEIVYSYQIGLSSKTAREWDIEEEMRNKGMSMDLWGEWHNHALHEGMSWE